MEIIILYDTRFGNTQRLAESMAGAVGARAEGLNGLDPKVRGYIEAHCMSCHDAESEKGDFRIDKLSNKCFVIGGCHERGLNVLTVGGAGGKRDGTAVRVADLADSTQDELLRQVRRKLRRERCVG